MKSEEELLELKRKKNRHYTNYVDVLNKITESCWHPESQQQKKSYYVEGGYDYTAYTKYYDECLICGKRLNETEVNHGWYG